MEKANTTSYRDGEEEWIESPHGWEEEDNNNNAAGVGAGAAHKKKTITVQTSNDDEEDDDDDEEEREAAGFFQDLFADSISNNARDSFQFELTIPHYFVHDYDDLNQEKENGSATTMTTTTTANTTTIHLEGFTVDSDTTARSTGVTLWKAAPRLGHFLQQPHVANACIRGKKVLELGAGLGLGGIVAHHLGARQVLVTDGDVQALQQLRTNVQRNYCENNTGMIECRQLIWGSLSSSSQVLSFQQTHGTFDTILGADVIYTQESLEPLFDTVVVLLKTTSATTGEGRFILSRYTKWNNVSDYSVLQAAQARNLDWTHPEEGIYIFFFPNEKNETHNKMQETAAN